MLHVSLEARFTRNESIRNQLNRKFKQLQNKYNITAHNFYEACEGN
jgi:hypothetical protein